MDARTIDVREFSILACNGEHFVKAFDQSPNGISVIESASKCKGSLFYVYNPISDVNNNYLSV